VIGKSLGDYMIFYFSGTGNSKHVAEYIKKKTGEELVSIADCNNARHYTFKLKKGERLGFVFPVYYWGLPSVVEEFVKYLRIEPNGRHYTYSVLTCGATTGGADVALSKLLKKKNIFMNASFALRMVDNYTVVFNVNDKGKNREINAAAEEELIKATQYIEAKASGNFNKLRGFWPAYPITHAAYNATRFTFPLRVSKDDCISCGKCAKECPTKTIIMECGKPVWINSRCSICLSCVHNCPANAISYGPTSKKNGQYIYEEM